MSIGACSGISPYSQSSGANYSPFPCSQSATPTLFAIQQLGRSQSNYNDVGYTTMNYGTQKSSGSSTTMQMFMQLMTMLMEDE